MRIALLLVVAAGGLWWFFHRSETPAPAPAPAPAAAEATWPKRNLDRAQAAVDAVRSSRQTE